MAIDKAAIFTGILERNALRREAQLPVRGVRATFEVEVQQALWREHVARHRERVRAKVIRDLRAQHGVGFGASTGGRWAIAALVDRELQASFRA